MKGYLNPNGKLLELNKIHDLTKTQHLEDFQGQSSLSEYLHYLPNRKHIDHGRKHEKPYDWHLDSCETLTLSGKYPVRIKKFPNNKLKKMEPKTSRQEYGCKRTSKRNLIKQSQAESSGFHGFIKGDFYIINHLESGPKI